MAYDGNGNGKFNWSKDRWTAINRLVCETSAAVCITRSLVKPCTSNGQGGKEVGYIDGHRVTSGPPLTISQNQTVSPTELSCDFQLDPNQYDTDDVANTLAIEAAYRVAAAEDAVILLGNGAQQFIKALGVNATNLEKQTGLFPNDPPPVVNQSILASITQGIKQLKANGRHYNYAVIVALDLYQQAFQERQNPFDAQINEIRPLLMEGGFLYSPAAPDGTGVIFSLAGGSIKLAVPMDANVQNDPEGKNVLLRVIEQIGLMVDVPEAVVALA